MRLISIEEYDNKTMQLAKPVFDKQKRVLLAAGRTIHPVYLDRLKAIDIRYLFVEDAMSFGITLDEMVDMPTWMDAIEGLQKAFVAASKNEELPIRDLQKLTIQLVEEVMRRKALILIPASSLAEDLRPYAHAVNVTLLSLQLARKMNISQMALKDLAIGALLHDIGKALTNDVSDHMRVGFEYLRKIREVSLVAAHVAYQHHEAADGSGKPRGLKNDQIHEFAQICSIANLYENALSIQGLAPHEAMEFMMTKSGSLFTTELIKRFVQEVPSYIPGTRVMINNGRQAIVTKIINSVQRPFIRYLDTGEEISLADHHTVLITGIMEKDIK